MEIIFHFINWMSINLQEKKYLWINMHIIQKIIKTTRHVKKDAIYRESSKYFTSTYSDKIITSVTMATFYTFPIIIPYSITALADSMYGILTVKFSCTFLRYIKLFLPSKIPIWSTFDKEIKLWCFQNN